MQSNEFWLKKYEEAIAAFPPAPNHHEAQYPIACNGIRAEIPESQIWQDIYNCQKNYGKTQPVKKDEIDNTIAEARIHAWDGHDRTGYAPARTGASYAPSKPAKALLAEATVTRGSTLIAKMKESTKDIADYFVALASRPDHAAVIKLEALSKLFRPSDYVYIGAIDGTPKKWFGELGGKPIKTMLEWAAWEHIDAYLSDPDVAYYCINPLKDALSKKAKNVAEYRYMLLEIDTQSLDDQAMIILYLMRAGLPIVSVVKSGNKSLHALIKIDGIKTADDYKKMAVSIIKTRLSIIGADSACINPDRMSRIHGAVTVDDKGRTRHQDVVYLCDDAEMQAGITLDDAIKILDGLGMSPVPAAENSEAEKAVETGLPWITVDDKNKKILDLRALADWLTAEGFCNEQLPTGFRGRLLRVQGNVYDVYDLKTMRDYVFGYVSINAPESHDFVLRQERLINEALVSSLPLRTLNAIKDTAAKVHIPYSNGMLAVNATDATLIPYADIDGMIARSAILAREYLPGVSPKGCDFDRFLELIMGNDAQRKDAICSALGYLVSRYKDEDCAKAILLTDLSVDDNHGRTGKGLLYKALSKVRPNGLMIDGKSLKNESNERFKFSGVTPETSLIHINDLYKGYDMESLFVSVVEDMPTQPKGKDVLTIPFSDSPKMLLTTNYWVRGVDPSSRARVSIYELDNHFTAEHTPKMEFGHLFFGTDWTAEEWAKFDSTMVSCVQTYLQRGLIAAKTSAESDIKKLRVECGEAFCDWIADNMPPTDGSFISNDFFNDFFEPKEATKADKTKAKKWMRTYADLTGLIFTDEQKKDITRARGFSIRVKGAIETAPKAGTPIPFSSTSDAEKAFLGDDNKTEEGSAEAPF